MIFSLKSANQEIGVPGSKAVDFRKAGTNEAETKDMRSFSKGLTLVELTVAMTIVAAIGVVGGRSLIQAVRVDREMRERADVLDKSRSIVDELRRTFSNLLTVKMGEYPPYSEGFDAAKGARVYQFLTRVPEHGVEGESPGDVHGYLVRYEAKLPGKLGLTLSRSICKVGTAGLVGKALEGVLAGGLLDFRLTPIYESERRESGGEDSGKKDVEVLSAFQVEIESALPDGERQNISILLPVPGRPEKEDNAANY